MAPTSPHTNADQFDDDLDDILGDVTYPNNVVQSTEEQTQPPSWNSNKNDTAGGLGVDEEIVITKKRQPAPKLDDQRLLSDPGIPRLRKISKERLRFKGKGHEYGDIARMLNMYQLWLDDLYPRAKFADALAIIEKVGHTKRMQMMRKDWIDEGKPRSATRKDEDEAAEKTPVLESAEHMDGVEQEGQGGPRPLSEHREPTNLPTGGSAAPVESGDPNEDELDALLAESDSKPTVPQTLPTRPAPSQDDPFADEMEAMADMDDMWD
ncbi:replication fork protection component Swi3 [Pyrenophora tritici-repentis]|uniref:Chromosome segregation in meiosis protein n=2 Tax=Pyrenophora tritici-repentis TaxID=45151 RepID=A0A2W1E1M4_9PLEO|nr:replication fork protection component Swi3 [Pyrenophora tritici-repentis Pt-1C-BFP]KAA8615523.1 replication fork protection component Swi3 [Pyrenophora tritici-repentis]EDU51446.1 replication fork protection component Swi3 [Pyrenophora tritici-repentis Pt-1C-BFP]KAF7443899.1 replicationk protection component Swi3 [Pyrenophora tritici-repentis]KAF7566379.1 replication fork protection component Swi3 [Pyrenophora tritici-repentis]KAG9379634.1 replicationk protection component Swi3 [Pyrenophora